MAATEQAIEEAQVTEQQDGLARLINRGGVRISLLDSDKEETGVFINLNPLDGGTRLQWDNKLRAAYILKGRKKEAAELQCYIWCWDKQVTIIEGIKPDNPLLQGLDPKKWFTVNPDGQVLLMTTIDVYFERQTARPGDSKP